MSPSIATFPTHPAFSGLRDHFAKMIDTGADVVAQATRQATELKRQWRVLTGPRCAERKTLFARMDRDKVDASDLLSLISWLEALASLDRSLATIAASDDITRHIRSEAA